jgi:flagellar biosynthesis protein FlhG
MNDQAATLRTIASRRPGETAHGAYSEKQRRCIAITGGKGGVGKSNLAVNLSLELGLLGNTVGLLDADFGLANADLLCGVLPKFHLGHVIAGLQPLNAITIPLSANVDLIPGGSGIEDLANFSFTSRPHILAQIREMEDSLSFMLIDSAAGIADNVSGVVSAASEVIIVVTPEPTSIVDAYATIKVILRHSPAKPISIVVNNVRGVGDAEHVFQSIDAAVRSFLDHHVEFLGMIPHDSQVQDAIREQVPVVRNAPDCPASRAIRLIAKQLHKSERKSAEVSSFWEALTKNDHANQS